VRPAFAKALKRRKEAYEINPLVRTLPFFSKKPGEKK